MSSPECQTGKRLLELGFIKKSSVKIEWNRVYSQLPTCTLETKLFSLSYQWGSTTFQFLYGAFRYSEVWKGTLFLLWCFLNEQTNGYFIRIMATQESWGQFIVSIFAFNKNKQKKKHTAAFSLSLAESSLDWGVVCAGIWTVAFTLECPLVVSLMIAFFCFFCFF